jgi:membrane-associated phospholipid phosphatase
MLNDHRRALWYALGLLAALGFVLFAVGKHPAAVAPITTLPFVGRFDQQMYDAVDHIRVTPLTWLFRFLNVVGGGIVTIPLRAIASIYLLVRRWWRRAAGFVLTWAVSELALTFLKAWFHRGRPPAGLVAIVGYSFPSGHATAAAATAVALVLAFIPAGPARRKWEWIAVVFAFVMACSRVYLHAHWFSDVVAGVLLGSGIALGAAALANEVASLALRRPVDRGRADQPDATAEA